MEQILLGDLIYDVIKHDCPRCAGSGKEAIPGTQWLESWSVNNVWCYQCGGSGEYCEIVRRVKIEENELLPPC